MSTLLSRPCIEIIREKSKFEVHGEERIEKEVRQRGKSRRVSLPPDGVGKRAKIIRIDER
jgi:putative transposon-encoded protein